MPAAPRPPPHWPGAPAQPTSGLGAALAPRPPLPVSNGAAAPPPYHAASSDPAAAASDPSRSAAAAAPPAAEDGSAGGGGGGDTGGTAAAPRKRRGFTEEAAPRAPRRKFAEEAGPPRRRVQWSEEEELVTVREFVVLPHLSREQQDALIEAELADAEEEARSAGLRLVDYDEEEEEEPLPGLAHRTAANMDAERYK